VQSDPDVSLKRHIHLWKWGNNAVNSQTVYPLIKRHVLEERNRHQHCCNLCDARQSRPLTLVITEMRFVFRTVRWISWLSEMFLDWRLYCVMSTGDCLQRRGVSYCLSVQSHSGSRSRDLLALKAKRIQSSETSTTICRSVLRNVPEEFYVLLTILLQSL